MERNNRVFEKEQFILMKRAIEIKERNDCFYSKHKQNMIKLNYSESLCFIRIISTKAVILKDGSE